MVYEDVGVAGLHRLAPALEDLRRADCVIVVAGQDAALASVVGGLVAAPVIGVPTSAGYGASFGGVAALLAMLTSCAAGVAVVNIDDGFGAGTIAARIARRASGRLVSRLAYVDAVGGIAGDMLLGALLDAGADADYVRDGLHGLPGGGVELRTATVTRHAIAAASVSIAAVEGPHTHRGWSEVREILDASAMPVRALARAHRVFAALARAEAAVHGIEPEAVTFHEVGAIDAIGDVCGIALALESLEIDELACSPLPAPRGLIGAAHGRLPIPAPAVLELLRGAPHVRGRHRRRTGDADRRRGRGGARDRVRAAAADAPRTRWLRRRDARARTAAQRRAGAGRRARSRRAGTPGCARTPC